MERVDDRERNGDSEFQDGSRVPHRSPYYEADDFRPVAVISSARRAGFSVVGTSSVTKSGHFG
jgi:hypothetical protein